MNDILEDNSHHVQYERIEFAEFADFTYNLGATNFSWGLFNATIQRPPISSNFI